MTSHDFWPDDLKFDAPSPITMMRQQARLIGEKTGGAIQGYVTQFEYPAPSGKELGTDEQSVPFGLKIVRLEIMSEMLGTTYRIIDLIMSRTEIYPALLTSAALDRKTQFLTAKKSLGIVDRHSTRFLESLSRVDSSSLFVGIVPDRKNTEEKYIDSSQVCFDSSEFERCLKEILSSKHIRAVLVSWMTRIHERELVGDEAHHVEDQSKSVD